MPRYWNPNENAKREFAQKMQAIDLFCAKHNITQNQSIDGDSYTFELNGLAYRVANHRVKASGSSVYTVLGEQIQHNHDEYPLERYIEPIHIHASKTRIIEIYNHLKDGKTLNGRGYVK